MAAIDIVKVDSDFVRSVEVGGDALLLFKCFLLAVLGHRSELDFLLLELAFVVLAFGVRAGDGFLTLEDVKEGATLLVLKLDAHFSRVAVFLRFAHLLASHIEPLVLPGDFGAHNGFNLLFFNAIFEAQHERKQVVGEEFVGLFEAHAHGNMARLDERLLNLQRCNQLQYLPILLFYVLVQGLVRKDYFRPKVLDAN